MLNKRMLEDKNLSLKAKGLLAYCMSKPDGWQFNIIQMASVLKEGKEAISSGFQELIEGGYCFRQRNRNDKGIFENSDYVLYETPENAENLKEKVPQPGFPDVDLPAPAEAAAAPYICSKTDVLKKERERDASPAPQPSQHNIHCRTLREPLQPSSNKKDKIAYRDNIFLTEDDFKKIEAKQGTEKLNGMLDVLSAKLTEKKYKYKVQDFMPGGWIEDAYLERNKKSKPVQSNPEIIQRNKKICEFVERKLQARSTPVMFFDAQPTYAELVYAPKKIHKTYEYQAYDADALKAALLNDLEGVFPGAKQMIDRKPTGPINDLVGNLASQMRLKI